MFSVIIHYAWLIVQALILAGLLLPVSLYAVYSIKKRVRKQPPESEELHEEKDYAIVVLANRETGSLQACLHSLQQLRYTNYLVYVVVNGVCADAYSADDRVTILRPGKTFRNALRLHRYAIENFRRAHTHLAIIDGNNLADQEYLNELNAFFNQGYQAVQTLSVPTKYSTLSDVLQTANCFFKRFFYGEAAGGLGCSLLLSTSGSAFTISLYKQCLKSAEPAGISLSAKLPYLVAEKGYDVAFAPKAILYNGETMCLRTLMMQHAYSINTWSKNFVRHTSLCLDGVNTLNRSRFLCGLLLLQPPALTIFLSGVLCLLANLRTDSSLTVLWAASLTMFSACFFIAPAHLRTRKLGEASLESSYPLSSLYEGGDELYNIAT